MMKTKTRKSGYQLNNKGMTFVEILVAVTMLTIVSLVFLRCISQSAFYNRDAREKQSALNLAQSLMEGFKAYDMESIEEQYTTGTYSDFKLYTLESTATKSKDASTGEYCLGGVEINGVKYDARVSVSNAASTKTTVVTQSGLVSSDVPNKYSDAIYCGKTIADEQAAIYQLVVDDLKTNAVNMKATDKAALTVNTLKLNKLNFLDATERNIYVSITDDKVEVTVSYAYQFTYEYEKEGGGTDTYTSPGANYTDATITCFDNSTTGVDLGNIYLYYYPAYKSNQGGQIRCNADTVHITNNAGNEKKVFLIKQHNRALSSGELSICESNYHPVVNQYGANDIVLYHNLNENLSGHGTVGYTPSGGITDKVEILDNANVSKAARTQQTLLYDVTISVYKTGSITPVYELSGTVNAR